MAQSIEISADGLEFHNDAGYRTVLKPNQSSGGDYYVNVPAQNGTLALLSNIPNGGDIVGRIAATTDGAIDPADETELLVLTDLNLAVEASKDYRIVGQFILACSSEENNINWIFGVPSGATLKGLVHMTQLTPEATNIQASEPPYSEGYILDATQVQSNDDIGLTLSAGDWLVVSVAFILSVGATAGNLTFAYGNEPGNGATIAPTIIGGSQWVATPLT